MEWLLEYSPVLLALVAILFTWFITAMGASIVFFFKTIDKRILNSMLAFAAGAMIFVVIEELIPESQREYRTDLSTMGAMMGFATMMILDVALG
jgi:ZIP family zinc transporter